MKKTQSISIAHTHFHIEDDAYAQLDTYLEAIKKKFKHEDDRDEIVSDIEARIAELFIEKTGESKIITKEHVQELITKMGAPDELSDTEPEVRNVKQEGKRRKFYRNEDDVVVAGICSGIAAFFSIDVLIIRIVFIVFTLSFGGSGFILYAILWLIVPAAKTTTEKLEMRGDPVTIESVTEAIKEKANAVKDATGKSWRTTLEFPIKIIARLVQFLKKFFLPIIGTTLGVLIAFISVIIFIGMTVALIASTLIQTMYYSEPSWAHIFENPWGVVGCIGIYIIVVVPIIGLVAVGTSLISRKIARARSVGIILIGSWIIGIIMTAIAGVSLSNEIVTFVQDRVQEETSLKSLEIRTLQNTPGQIKSIVASDDVHVTITMGTTTSIELEGTPEEIEGTYVVTKDDGTLIAQASGKGCVFCTTQTAHVKITLPYLEKIEVSNTASVSGIGTITSDNLSLVTGDLGTIEITANTKSLQTESNDLSKIRINGTTQIFSVVSTDLAIVEARNLVSTATRLKASEKSEIHVGTTTAIIATTKDIGIITYKKTDSLIEHSTDLGSIKKQD
jgi:phage shock protein PspC (stress-responsive transcriptional regulator)